MAAVGIVLYAQFVFHSIYIGFSNGVAPVISYNYGEQNFAQLKRLYRICMKFIVAVSIIAFAASLVFAKPIASVFTGNDLETLIWLYVEYAYSRFLTFCRCERFCFGVFHSAVQRENFCNNFIYADLCLCCHCLCDFALYPGDRRRMAGSSGGGSSGVCLGVVLYGAQTDILSLCIKIKSNDCTFCGGCVMI